MLNNISYITQVIWEAAYSWGLTD